MKKLLFSAMACIAFASSAFASDTSLMIPEYPCEIYVTVIDRETGDILEVSANLSKIGGVPCLELGRGQRVRLQLAGVVPDGPHRPDHGQGHRAHHLLDPPQDGQRPPAHRRPDEAGPRLGQLSSSARTAPPAEDL